MEKTVTEQDKEQVLKIVLDPRSKRKMDNWQYTLQQGTNLDLSKKELKQVLDELAEEARIGHFQREVRDPDAEQDYVDIYTSSVGLAVDEIRPCMEDDASSKEILDEYMSWTDMPKGAIIMQIDWPRDSEVYQQALTALENVKTA